MTTGPKYGYYSDEPMLTASEVKVLTETASKVAYALGRKDAGEEIAAAIDNNHGWQTPAQQEALDLAARIARNVGDRNLPPQPLGDASDATSGVPGHPGVSEDPVTDTVDLVGALRKAVDAARERRLAEAAKTSTQEPCGHPTCPCAEGNTP